MTLVFEEEPGDSHGVASNCGWMLKYRPITFDFACLTLMEPTRIRLGLGSFFCSSTTYSKALLLYRTLRIKHLQLTYLLINHLKERTNYEKPWQHHSRPDLHYHEPGSTHSFNPGTEGQNPGETYEERTHCRPKRLK